MSNDLTKTKSPEFLRHFWFIYIHYERKRFSNCFLGSQCLWQKFLVLIESAKKPRFAAVEVHYSRSLSPVLELLLGWCYYLFRNMAFTTDVHCVLIEIRISTRVQNSLSLLSFPNTAHSRYKSDLLAFSDDTIKLNQDQKLGFH